MAVAFFGRALIPKPSLALIISRSYTVTSLSIPRFSLSSTSSYPLLRLRPLVALTEFRRFPSSVSLRCFATRPTASSLNDPNPNWSNRPPKETILLDGCDFEHWLVVLEKPEGEPTRDEIIDSYIKTLAMVVGSEEEARMKIYSVSTRHYFAFGALVSEELSLKIKELPRVRWVLPDSYLDVKNKDYGGEPFIDGRAVPYDPKYHEEWVRNNARANERNRRNDRPRNFDRSRNFERRRENMQNRDFQSREMPPMPNRDMQNPVPNMSNVPPPNQGMQNNIPNMGSIPPNQGMQTNVPNQGMPNMGGVPPNQGIQNTIPNIGGIPPNQGVQNTIPNMGRMPPNQGTQMGGMPPTQANAGYTNNMPYRDAGPNPGYSNNMPYRDSGSNAGYSNNMNNNMPYRDSGSNAGYSNNMNNNMPYRDAGPNSGYSNNMPNRDAGMNPGYANNAPNRDFQNRDVPHSGGGVPYQGIPNSAVPNRDYQNSYIPNRDIGGGMQGGNQSQVRDLPGRDMPPGPNRDY